MRWLIAILLASALAFSLPQQWIDMARQYDFSFAIKDGKVFLLTWMGNYTVWFRNGRIENATEGLEGKCDYKVRISQFDTSGDPYSVLKEKFMKGEMRLEGCNIGSSVKAFILNSAVRFIGFLERFGLRIF